MKKHKDLWGRGLIELGQQGPFLNRANLKDLTRSEKLSREKREKRWKKKGGVVRKRGEALLGLPKNPSDYHLSEINRKAPTK